MPRFRISTLLLASASTGRIVPVYRRLFGDTLTPVEAYRRIERGHFVVSLRECRRRRKDRTLQFPGRRSVPADRSVWKRRRRDPADGQRSEQFQSADPLRDLERLLAHIGPCICPGCRGFAAAPSATPATTSSATASACPMRRRTIADIPDMAFAFYDRMVIFDQISKTILVVAHTRPGSTAICAMAYDSAAARVDELCTQLESASTELRLCDIRPDASHNRTRSRTSTSAAEFESAVATLPGIHPGGRHLSGRHQPTRTRSQDSGQSA